MSKYDDLLKIIKTKNFDLWKCISDKMVLVSPVVIESVSSLSSSNLEKLYRSIPSDYYPCRIFIAQNAIGSDSANIAIRATNKPGSRIIYPFMPIKQTPTYNPDAEIEGLAYTIPVWESSIRQKCKEINFEKTSERTRVKLLNALVLLEVTASKYINEIQNTQNKSQK